jgi:hypothetical protein
MNILPVDRLLSIINPVKWQAFADISAPVRDCNTLCRPVLHDISYRHVPSSDIDSRCYNNSAFAIGPYDDDGDEG